MRPLAIIGFFIFLGLIIGPDAMPGVPFDDIIYAIIDILLAKYIVSPKKPPAENPPN